LSETIATGAATTTTKINRSRRELEAKLLSGKAWVPARGRGGRSLFMSVSEGVGLKEFSA
jgi:hypothetical protein